jgi:hypothetical protein
LNLCFSIDADCRESKVLKLKKAEMENIVKNIYFLYLKNNELILKDETIMGWLSSSTAILRINYVAAFYDRLP